MKKEYKNSDMGAETFECPYCGVPLDSRTLWNLNFFCPECQEYVSIDELEEDEMLGYESARDHYWDDYWDNYDYGDSYYNKFFKEDEKEEEDNTITSFVIRFITSIKYEDVKKSFLQLDGDIDYLELLDKGPIKQFLDTTSGDKLLRGLDINKTSMSEYVLHASFFLKDNDKSKKILISTLCKAFPLCVIREEESSFIMANNKGLAKGLLDICNEDEIELLSWFLTGYEKVLLLKYFLWNCEPYRARDAKNIMVKWIDDSLITLAAIREKKEIPLEWQAFLAEKEDIKVSVDDKDSGTTESFELMLEDVVDRLESFDKIDKDEIINVVSLRGTADFSLTPEEGENKNDVKSK